MKKQFNAKHKKEEKNQKTDRKYQKYKFFELKKLSKLEKQLLIKAENEPDNEELRKELQEIQDKFSYIKMYPSGKKYISILKEPSDPKIKKIRKKLLVKAVYKR